MMTPNLLRPKRSENFSLPEIIFILDRIKMKGDILFHSATNPHSRARGWEEIIQELHQQHPNWPVRNEHQLRNWWRKAKTYARKYHFWKVTGKGFQVGFKRAETVPKLVLEIIQQHESPENTFPTDTSLTSNSYDANYGECDLTDNILTGSDASFDIKTELQDDCMIVGTEEQTKPESKQTNLEPLDVSQPTIESRPQMKSILNTNEQFKKRQILPKPLTTSRTRHRRTTIGFPFTTFPESDTFINQPDRFQSNSYPESHLSMNSVNYFQAPTIFPGANSSSPNFIRTSPRMENKPWDFQDKPLETVRLEMETMRHKKEMELLDFKLKAAYEEHAEKMKYLREKQRQLILKNDANLM